LAALPLAIGDQRLRGPGTGVAAYSSALIRALADGGRSLLTMEPGTADVSRYRRWLRAARPGGRCARRTDEAIICADLFREAQVYFDIWRRPMEIDCPGVPGIVHWTYPVPLRLRGWRNVYTFHDTIPIDHPSLSPIATGRYQRMLRALMDKASRIATVSEASKRDIERLFAPPAGFVVNLGEAVEVGHELAPLPAGLLAGHYLLHCGSIEPRKNVAGLIEAWRTSGAEMPLVLAGPAGWRSGPILAQARDGLIHLDYLPRDQLLGLIASARALVMPSLAEGFGLPVAEAMALGTPVVTSVEGALAETAGDAALTVDPCDTTAIATALRRVAKDDLLCERLVASGKARSVAFSIEAFGRRLSALYDEVGRDG